MKKLLILPALFLAGCQTSSQIITSKEQVVIEPPSSMYNCPSPVYIPKPEALTDLQVARLVAELHKDNGICKNSLSSIKKFITEAKSTVESKPANQ